MMKTRILMLIWHICLFLMLIPAIISHIINSNTFGLITGLIAEICWISLTIMDILKILELKANQKITEELSDSVTSNDKFIEDGE